MYRSEIFSVCKLDWFEVIFFGCKLVNWLAHKKIPKVNIGNLRPLFKNKSRI